LAPVVRVKLFGVLSNRAFSDSARDASGEPIVGRRLSGSWRGTVVDTRHIQAYIGVYMRRVSLFLSEDLLAGLDRLKAQHGTPHAESVRRAIAAYLVQKGVSKATQKGGKRSKRQK
jgi:hypothetical protein